MSKTIYSPLLSPPTRATCLAHLIILDVITLMKFGEQDRSGSNVVIIGTDRGSDLPYLGPIQPSVQWVPGLSRG
jgi:hypothetical protein